MDSGSFDRLARMLATAATRRSGLRAALGAAATGVALGGVATAAAGKRPGKQGPCGSGSVADNRCTQDSECCTKICDLNLGKDGRGRCRCRKRGQACTEDINCCVRRGQQMVCLAGICAMPVTCLGLQAVCTGSDTCCAGSCSSRVSSHGSESETRGGSTICCVATFANGCNVGPDCCLVGSPCIGGVCQLPPQ